MDCKTLWLSGYGFFLSNMGFESYNSPRVNIVAGNEMWTLDVPVPFPVILFT